MSEIAELFYPAIRWDASRGYEGERNAIELALKLGVGGFILFGGPSEQVAVLTENLHSKSRIPLLIGADLERGAGQQFAGETALPPLDPNNLYPTNAAVSQTNPPQQDLTAAEPATNLTLPNQGGTPALESGATRDYVVVRNDNFTTIARKFGLTPTAVAKANPGVNSTQLKVGQKLVIPASSSPAIAAANMTNGGENLYVIKTGDTLSKIATTHGTSVTELKSLNGLKTDRIKVGDKLKLPASRNAPATATPAATNPGTPTTPGGTGNI